MCRLGYMGSLGCQFDVQARVHGVVGVSHYSCNRSRVQCTCIGLSDQLLQQTDRQQLWVRL